jgi:branched-chain amino acid transport system permease protein
LNLAIELLSGLAVGCIYGLVAVGFSMVFRATGLVNFAQGDIMMVGAFIGFSIIVAAPSVPFWAVIILAALASAALGFLIERLALWPAVRRNADQTYLVMLTLGVGIVLSNGARALWGGNPLVYPTAITHEVIMIAGYPMPGVYPYIAATMLLLLVGLHLLFTRSWIGLALRAAADDPQTASVMGINLSFASALSFAIASGIGGAAGVLYAPITFASFDMGLIGIKAFAAAVLGSLGSIPGAILSGLIIELGETFGGQLLAPEYQDSMAFILMIAILLVRPTGLFGKGVRS